MKTLLYNSTLINLVGLNQIPFSRLLHGSDLQELQDLYHFKNIVDEINKINQPSLEFRLGMNHGKTEETIIQRVQIEERKIIIEVDGSSHVAEEIYTQLQSFLRKLTDNTDEDFLSPVVQTFESVIIAQLDFDVRNLVNPKYLDFVNNQVLEAAESKHGTVSPSLHTIRFVLKYMNTDKELLDYQITLARKEFAITHRDGTKPEDRIYVCQAPVSTDAHIKLLEEFEKISA